ncbi:MAG: hydrogenase maturation protease [Candidatus Nanopelagicales bacterium]
MKPLVVGLGSVDRGDDAVGFLVVRQVADVPGVDVVEVSDPSRLVDLGAGRDVMVLVDAVSSGSAPGTVHVLEVGEEALPIGSAAASTHWVGLGEVIELARVLDMLPVRVVLVGIEAGSLEHGSGLSASVREAVPAAITAVLESLA